MDRGVRFTAVEMGALQAASSCVVGNTCPEGQIDCVAGAFEHEL